MVLLIVDQNQVIFPILVNDNHSFNELKENDILFIKDNLYGYIGNIAHTEFLITPWVNQHIFKNFKKFKIVPVVSYISIDSNNIINFKELFALTIYYIDVNIIFRLSFKIKRLGCF